VLLVDDHAVVREGYRRLLERHPDLKVVGEAGAAAEALEQDARLKPDVVVLDIALPGLSGVEVLRRLLARRPDARVLIFSMHHDRVYATQALKAGARGFLSKSSAPDLLVMAVRAVAGGAQFLSPDVEQALSASKDGPALLDSLSPRELEILQLLSQGMDIAAISEKLGLSPKTAANHQSAIRQKLGVSNALQLVLVARQAGLIGS
jgi:DNA-binding NarL/FixJ family response regulator